jgi:hypothetical protein
MQPPNTRADPRRDLWLLPLYQIQPEAEELSLLERWMESCNSADRDRNSVPGRPSPNKPARTPAAGMIRPDRSSELGQLHIGPVISSTLAYHIEGQAQWLSLSAENIPGCPVSAWLKSSLAY